MVCNVEYCQTERIRNTISSHRFTSLCLGVAAMLLSDMVLDVMKHRCSFRPVSMSLSKSPTFLLHHDNMWALCAFIHVEQSI